jgi:anti-sigma factor RsiW
MNCQKFVEQLLEFVAGELDSRAHDEVHQHMGDCPKCHTYVQTYRLVITISRQLPPVPLPTHFAQRLEQLLKQLDEFRPQQQ